MKLKRLVLQGYKTFATKTEFLFDEGITAIVGPNGSGKSNVADAVRWVLGEQSYSTLRGKRTADMIFSGSQSRPRSGMAQAILTLDNSDGWLPIDYTEVEIGRRAYHSGENDYVLNGQKVRLKDITDLLAQSGLAERTYTIIGQGLVDQALSLRAEERRALFEEAAGINHYKIKRATTLRQLQETQRNLERVHDILAEIRPRLTSLKRQATRARNFEQITTDLRQLLRIWYGYRWEQAKEKLRLARETAASTENIWQESRQRLLVQQDDMNSLRRRINRRQQQIQELAQERDEVRERLERSRREVAILQERRHSLQEQLANLTQELPLLEGQRTDAAAGLEAATSELAAAQENLQELEQVLHRFDSSLGTQQAEINRQQQSVRQAEEKQRASQNALAQAEGQLSQLQEQLAELEQAVGAADTADSGAEKAVAAEAAELAQELEKLAEAQESAATRTRELSEQRESLQEQRRRLIGELKQQRRAFAEQNRELSRQQKETARLETRVEMLDQMRGAGVPSGSKARVLGQLSQFLTIPAQYETAIAAALTTRLSTVLLPDADALWQIVSQPNKRGIIAAALTALNPPPTPPLPEKTDVIGWAIDHIRAQAKARPLAQLLLNRVILVHNEQDALRLAQELPPGALAVTPDGIVVHAGGLVETGGQHQQNNILAREAEWRAAKESLTGQRADLAKREEAQQAIQREIDAKQEQVDELQQEERRLGRLEQEAQQRATRAQRDFDRAQQQRSFLERQQAAATRQRVARQEEKARLVQRIAGLEKTIEASRTEVAAAETAVVQARDRLQALPVAEVKQQRLNAQQQITAAQTIVAGRQTVVDSRRTTLHQISNQIQRLQERQAGLHKQQQQLDLTQEEQKRQQLQDGLDELEGQLQPAREKLATYRAEMRGLEEAMAKIQRRTMELETYYTQAQVKLSQEESHIEGLQERIKADLGIVALTYDEEQTGPTPLPIDDFIEELPEVTELPDDIEESIHNYRGQLQRMGAVNPDAPEEYEETQERYDFLSQQVEDLYATERQLRDVIAELDELTSTAFAETVQKVNAVFGETFQQLFGGGSARLMLTDPDDLTVSGVDIIARLPNRREQGLGLLSGGERSLTAAALIFSLLKVSPTPFCVMDEVDAALDEANINRFRELLRELSMKSQFVVITHNRGTVQAAQTIYGISMGNDSTSQCISIKPEDYLKQAALL